MRKKGQVSLFLIFGTVIIIFIAVILFLYFKGFLSDFSPFLFSRNTIDSYVTDCMDSTLADAIGVLGIQGGAIQIPLHAALNTSENSTTMLLLDRGLSAIPTIPQIEENLSVYVEENIVSCLQDFMLFTERGIGVSYGEPHAQITVLPQSVIHRLDFPIIVTKEDSEITVDEFYSVLEEVRIPYIINATAAVVEYSLRHEMGVDMTTLDKYDLDFTVTAFNKSVLLYQISDAQSRIWHDAYRFRFGISFH